MTFPRLLNTLFEVFFSGWRNWNFALTGHDTEAQKSKHPYKIKRKDDEKKIKITIKEKDDETFKGIMIKAVVRK